MGCRTLVAANAPVTSGLHSEVSGGASLTVDVGAKQMRAIATILLVLFAVGWGAGPERHSGDLVFFLCQEIPKSGGRISFTGWLPRAETKWTSTISGNRLEVNAAGDQLDTVSRFLHAAFGNLKVSTNSVQGERHRVYVSPWTGTVVECVGTTNSFKLLCVTPAK
jgi:hypothetical protein